MINRGGLKISSMEVEDTLYRHPAVLETAVVAVPHPQLGEDIRAFVALRPGMRIEAEELRAHCAALSRRTRCRATSALSTRCRATAWAKCRRPNSACSNRRLPHTPGRTTCVSRSRSRRTPTPGGPAARRRTRVQPRLVLRHADAVRHCLSRWLRQCWKIICTRLGTGASIPSNH